MTTSALQIIADQEKKIVFLENQLRSILGLIEVLASGNTEKAKSSLSDYKESTALTLNRLIEKFSSFSTFPLTQENKTDLFLKIIIESMPFPVFVKDEDARYIYVNAHEATLFNLKESDILGKHDSDFIKNSEEMDMISKSDAQVLLKNKSIVLPNQKFSLLDGRSFVFRTHKIPFENPVSGKSNILGFSVDVTDTVNLEKLKKVLFNNSNPYK